MEYRELGLLWQENATLVCATIEGGSERSLLREGKLWEVLVHLGTMSRVERARMLIALPDRHVPPTRVDAVGIEAMLHRTDRPGYRFVE